MQEHINMKSAPITIFTAICELAHPSRGSKISNDPVILGYIINTHTTIKLAILPLMILTNLFLCTS